jgi:CheY-like chemotaxis protein
VATGKKKSDRKVVALIEDDPDIAATLKIGLEMKGLEVRHAMNGRAGLEMIQQERPDGLVIDIMMPKMNGLEVLAALQSKRSTASIPTMVLTGILEDEDDKQEEEWRKRLEIDDFVRKPFDTPDLVKRVLNMMGLKDNAVPDSQSSNGA